jgi:hypothetical protein
LWPGSIADATFGPQLDRPALHAIIDRLQAA